MVRISNWRTSCTLSEDMMFFFLLLFVTYTAKFAAQAARVFWATFAYLYQMSVSVGPGCRAPDVKLHV